MMHLEVEVGLSWGEGSAVATTDSWRCANEEPRVPACLPGYTWVKRLVRWIKVRSLSAQRPGLILPVVKSHCKFLSHLKTLLLGR